MTQRQDMRPVMQPQLMGSMNEDIVAKGMERLTETSGGHDAAASSQPTGFQVFQHKEITLFSGKGDRLIHCRFSTLDDRRELLNVGRQGGYPHRTGYRQTLYFRQIGERTQPLDEHDKPPGPIWSVAAEPHAAVRELHGYPPRG